MNIAISCWQGRVSPLFDVSRCACLCWLEGGAWGERQLVVLPEAPAAKLEVLVSLATCELICGAISRPLQSQARQAGLVLYPFIAGELEQVMAARLNDHLQEPAFAMPGCCGRHRRRRCGRRNH